MKFHAHAVTRMVERGASEEEVTADVFEGERFAAKFGRQGFRRNFAFGDWKVQLSYDVSRNIAYLRLRESAGVQVETVRLSDEVNVDLAPDGTVYGIELLNANAQLRAADGGRFVVVDEVAGHRIEVPLPKVA